MKKAKIFIVLLITVTLHSHLNAQRTIKGKVVDETGQHMPSVSVQVATKNNITVTDSEGNFEMGEVVDGDVLQFSFIGYITKRITIPDGQTYLEISMEFDTLFLENIVVVGYGVKEKVNVTGSVVSIDAKAIENRGVSNISNILSGQSPGLTVLQRGGSPGRNQGQIIIRGIGTLGASAKSKPLIIVDGIETGSLVDINPEDVANISVLKDAAAASIYGVRAANGVILVTTKRGKEGKPIFSYSFQYGVSEPTRLPEKVNATELAQLLNEAQRNEGLTTRTFSATDIDLFASGTQPYTHANSDQLSEIFTEKGIRQVHNLSVMGGAESTQYNVSLGYTQENGLMPNTGMQRYNFRTNLDLDIKENLTSTINLSGVQRLVTDPIVGVGGIIHRAYREWANDPIRRPGGQWARPIHALGRGVNHNAVSLVHDGGFKDFTDTRITGTFTLEYKPWDFISFKGIMATVQDFNRSKIINKSFSLYNHKESKVFTARSKVQEARDHISDINLQFIVNYHQKIENHEVKALLGSNARKIESSSVGLSAFDLRNNNLDQINAADVNKDDIFGNTSDYRLISYFGRVNYIYDRRYLLEGNVRYDGTSRFSKNNRFNIFPSFSLGWRISEEKFLSSQLITDFKVRASWGMLGNQEIGDYRHLNTYTFDQTALINNEVKGGATERLPLGNPDIIWETSTVSNAGLDIAFFEGTLTFQADYFVKEADGILIQRPLPAAFGAGISTANFPFVNAASAKNQGFELDLGYKKKIGELSIRANANLSKVQTEITDLKGADRPGLRVGDPIANIFGYEALGIFQTQDEIDAHADQTPLGLPAKPGDIKYKDISGPAGKPDGIINDWDRKSLGSFFPSINYGFSFSVAFKGFDLSTLWQGAADVQAEIGGKQRQPFYLGASPWKLHLDRAIINRNGEVSNPNARFPRTLINGKEKNYVTSSWWVENTSFVKLRNLQIGYSLPTKLLDKLKLKKLRVYISGENLLVVTQFKGYDPEIPTSGSVLPLFSGNSGYPVTRTYIMGLNLTF